MNTDILLWKHMIIARTKNIFLICLLSLVVHLPGIASPLLDIHSWRQTQTASIARNYYENGYHFLSPQINWEGHSSNSISTEFPVYNYILALFWPVAGLGDIWGRILSSFFSILSAVYLYLLAKELLDEKTALLSALVFAVLPVNIYFTHTVQPEALGLLGIMGGLYHIRKDGWKHMATAAAFLALAPLVKLPYAYVWLPAAWLSFSKKKGTAGLIALGIPVIAIFVWYGYFAGRASVQVVPARGGLLSLITEGNVWLSWTFYEKLFVSRFPELLTTYSGLIFLAIGIWRYHKISGYFFALWFWSGVAYLILGGYYTYVHEYTLLPLTAPVAVFISLGFWRLRESERKWLKHLALILLVAIPTHAGLRIRHWYGLRDSFLLEAKEVVSEISGKSDLFLCNTDNLPLYLYHIHRNGFTKVIKGAHFRQELSYFQDKDVKFFITTKTAIKQDKEIENYVRDHFLLAHEGREYLIFKMGKR